MGLAKRASHAREARVQALAWLRNTLSRGFSVDEAHDRDDGGVFLNGALELERIVISAAGSTGVFAARFGAGFVNRAAAGFRMQEFAGFTEKRIFVAFQNARSVRYFRVFARGFFDGNSKMVCQAFDVEIADFNALVDRATERNAFRAIIMPTRFLGGQSLSP